MFVSNSNTLPRSLWKDPLGLTLLESPDQFTVFLQNVLLVLLQVVV